MSLKQGKRVVAACFVAWGLVGVTTASAQQERTVDVGVQVNALRLSEFDTGDAGVGIESAWRVTPLLAIEGALSWFPGGGDDETSRVENQGRVLGLVGVRSGIQRGPVELFARARPGFLRFADKGPVPCIAIFPPPLECQVLGGYTAFVTELGAGARFGFGAESRAYVSFDVGDLLVRYDKQAIRPDGSVTDGFVSHNLLASVGVGWKF